MTIQEIIDSAYKSGITSQDNILFNAYKIDLVQFARLIIKEDRNKICAYIEEDHSPYDRADRIVDAIRSGAI